MSNVITDKRTRKYITAMTAIESVVTAAIIVCCVLIIAVVIPGFNAARYNYYTDNVTEAVMVGATFTLAVLGYVCIFCCLLFIAVVDICSCVAFFKNRVRVSLRFDENTDCYKIFKTYDLAFVIGCLTVVFSIFEITFACVDKTWEFLGFGIGIFVAEAAFLVLNRLSRMRIRSDILRCGYSTVPRLNDFSRKEGWRSRIVRE